MKRLLLFLILVPSLVHAGYFCVDDTVDPAVLYPAHTTRSACLAAGYYWKFTPDSTNRLPASVLDSTLMTETEVDTEISTHTALPNAHHTPTVDTNTNSTTECTGTEVLNASSQCVEPGAGAHSGLTDLDYASSGHTGFAPALGVDDNYVTDTEKAVLQNTSGTNTGDQTDITGNAATVTNGVYTSTEPAAGELSGSFIAGFSIVDGDKGDVNIALGVWNVENDSHDHTTASLPNVLADLDGLCSANEIPKWSGTAWECQADSTGGTPTFDSVATGTNTAADMTVGTGSTLGYSGSGTIAATTAAALAADGSNCSAGEYALGVGTDGAAQGCTDATTEIDSAISTAATNYATAAQGATADTALQPGDVDDTPVNGATAVPPSSNWAFDHVAATDPHTGYFLETDVNLANFSTATIGTSEILGVASNGDITAYGAGDPLPVLIQPEGTAILSTGETGGTKFLREDGDGTSSWQDVVTTESDPVVAAINGLVKSNGTTIAVAVAGTDYTTPTGSAETMTVNASGFTGNLGATDDTIQEIADAVDGLSTSSSFSPTATNNQAGNPAVYQTGNCLGDPRYHDNDPTTGCEAAAATNVWIPWERTGLPVSDKYDPLAYGAYFDGTSHTLNAAYFTANSWLYPQGTWSSGGSYSLHDIVKSGTTVYQANIDGGEAEDPALDTNYDYWFPIYAEGDEADHIAVQFLLSRYARARMSPGGFYSDDTRPLIISRIATVLEGAGWFTYENQTGDLSNVTRILDNNGAADNVVVMNMGSVIRDFTVINNTTQTGGWGITYDDTAYGGNATTTMQANLNRVNIVGLENGIRYLNNIGYMRADTISLRNIENTNILVNAAGANGDSDFDNIQMQNDPARRTSGDYLTTVGLQLDKFEQLNFNHIKTINVAAPVRFNPLATSAARAAYFYEPSFEQFPYECFLNESATYAVERLRMIGGKCSQIIPLNTAADYAFDTTLFDDVALIGFDLVANGKGGYINGDGFKFIGGHGWQNDTELYNSSDVGTGTYETDSYTFYIGADSEDTIISGSTFADASNANKKGYISVTTGAGNHKIVDSYLGNLTHASAESITDATTTGYYSGNSAVEDDIDSFQDIASLVANDSSVDVNDTGAGSDVEITVDTDTTFTISDANDAYGSILMDLASAKSSYYPAFSLYSYNGCSTGACSDSWKSPYFVGKTARGTQASPVAVVSGDPLFTFDVQGQYGGTVGNWGRGAQISAVAAANFSSTVYATDWNFLTTSSNAAPVNRFTIGSDGVITVPDLSGSYGTYHAYVCVDDDGNLTVSQNTCHTTTQ